MISRRSAIGLIAAVAAVPRAAMAISEANTHEVIDEFTGATRRWLLPHGCTPVSFGAMTASGSVVGSDVICWVEFGDRRWSGRIFAGRNYVSFSLPQNIAFPGDTIMRWGAYGEADVPTIHATIRMAPAAQYG